MIARVLVASASAASLFEWPARAQTPAAPGITMTLDGGEFHNQQIALRPMAATCCSNWWESHRDPRVNRLVVCPDAGKGGWEFILHSPRGTHVFAKDDGDTADRNPYLDFQLRLGSDLSARPRSCCSS